MKNKGNKGMYVENSGSRLMDTESLFSILLWSVHSPFPGILSQFCQFRDVLESGWLWDVESCLRHLSQHRLEGDTEPHLL